MHGKDARRRHTSERHSGDVADEYLTRAGPQSRGMHGTGEGERAKSEADAQTAGGKQRQRHA